MSAKACWHRERRALVLVTQDGTPWRVRPAGPAIVRGGPQAPFFNLERIDADVVRLDLGGLSRRFRLAPTRAPAGDGWTELGLAQLERLLFGRKKGHGALKGVIGTVVRTGVFAGAVLEQISEFLRAFDDAAGELAKTRKTLQSGGL